uniref:NADH-ubiquinone oxidoreductase chain 4L n=1 Tax=Stereophaedusa valida striatella TaxID=1885821 RepID=A0A224ACJ9_9EUPU|nr:NADH dehydrogenase subunit 4L [Stereophaedusa valida striatella]
MYLYWTLFFFMVFLLMFLLSTKVHFLRAFLILEAIMLTVLIISIFFLMRLQFEPFMFLVLLTFAVCEAGLGLSLLLTYIKSTGSDMIQNQIF